MASQRINVACVHLVFGVEATNPRCYWLFPRVSACPVQTPSVLPSRILLVLVRNGLPMCAWPNMACVHVFGLEATNPPDAIGFSLSLRGSLFFLLMFALLGPGISGVWSGPFIKVQEFVALVSSAWIYSLCAIVAVRRHLGLEA